MLRKKGQVSLVIIAGIIILVLFFIMAYSFVNLPTKTNLEEGIYEELDECADIASEEAVYVLGWQGGLIIPDKERMMSTYLGDISYAYYEGVKTLPLISEMEDQLEFYTNTIVSNCFDNISNLEEGWSIEKGNPQTKAVIMENSVIFDINYPVVLRKGDVETAFSDFNSEVPVRLGYIYSIISNIIEIQVQNTGLIPASYAGSFDLKVTAYYYNNGNFVYEFRDEQPKGDYRFFVANKFKERGIDESL